MKLTSIIHLEIYCFNCKLNIFFLSFALLLINVFRNKYFITKEFPVDLLKMFLHGFAQNTVLLCQFPAKYKYRKQGEENTKAKRDGNKKLPATPVPTFSGWAMGFHTKHSKKKLYRVRDIQQIPSIAFVLLWHPFIC